MGHVSIAKPGAAMQSEIERARSRARLQAVLICALLEGMAVLTVRPFTGGYGEAAIMSALWLGPLSLWVGPPLYRWLLRASA